tara:strand:+ start:108 stop:458 length:351 start_codon:yes stop_codon:yes gene_type:complete
VANGDITKEVEYDKIEVINTWAIHVRKATKIMEEQSDGSKKEISRSFHRHVLVPFGSTVDDKGKWTHTATDLSKENAKVKAIAEAAWDSDTKTAYKNFTESLGRLDNVTSKESKSE